MGSGGVQQGSTRIRPGEPKAVVEGAKVFEFGTMPQNTTGKHTWIVRNEGQGILELWMISSTCSCTLAKFKDGKKAFVKPGESTEITLEFETRQNNGLYEKGADIGSNDPNLPKFMLHVHGKVYPAVMVYPPLEGERLVNFLMDISNDVDELRLPGRRSCSKDRPETKIVKVTSSDPAAHRHLVGAAEGRGARRPSRIWKGPSGSRSSSSPTCRWARSATRSWSRPTTRNSPRSRLTDHRHACTGPIELWRAPAG